MIKTFRGLLTNIGGGGDQQRLKLSTIKGKVGYRIKRFQVIGQDANETYECAVLIWKHEQTSVSHDIDFSNDSLLGAILYQSNVVGETYPIDQVVIFDQETFNQDIYVTYAISSGDASINFYIELEVVSLSDMGAEYTTIKDIRTAVTETI